MLSRKSPINSHWSILDLTAQTVGVLFTNFSPIPISSRILPPPVNFTVSGFLWDCLIHLVLSLLQGDKKGSLPILLHDNCLLC